MTIGRLASSPCCAANSARVIVGRTSIHQWMAHKIHRHACVAINFLFKRKNHDHSLHQAFHDAHAPGAPSPYLRTDEVAHRNARVFQAPGDAQMRARRVHQDRKRSAALCGFARQPILHADHRGNFVQHFGDPDHRDFVIVGNQFDARFGHSRAAHAEERRAPVRARSAVARRAAYMSLDASPAEIRICGGSLIEPTHLNCWKVAMRCLGGCRKCSLERKAPSSASIIGRQRLRKSGSAARRQRRRKFLLLVLQLVEAVVNAAKGEQFLMRALFAQAPFVEDENAIRVLDGAEAVRDHDGGAAFEQTVERFADHHFRLGVDARSGFVENQEFRIVRQGAREAHQLALADGKSGAALGDRRFHALRQRIEKRPKADFAERVAPSPRDRSSACPA